MKEKVQAGKVVAVKVAQVVKVAVVVVVAITSLVGGYVIANAELRNSTIDYAQNQGAVQAEELPKGR